MAKIDVDAKKKRKRDEQSSETKKKKKAKKKDQKAKGEKKSKKEKKAKKEKKEKKEKKTTKNPGATSGGVDADAYRKREEISTVDGEDGAGLPDPIQSFDALPFGKRVVEALTQAYAAPYPIQAQGWPVALAGDDMVAVAKTGSGKTLGFLLPGLQQIRQRMIANTTCGQDPQMLVLAPTRELTMQIKLEADKFLDVFSPSASEMAEGGGAGGSVRCAVLYGGVPKPPQKKELNKCPQVVVATPGRLVDLMQERALSLASVDFLVLDEADRMLDMGFEPQIAKIINATKQDGSRQTLCFTATWPKSVKKMAARYLRKPKQAASDECKGLVQLTIGGGGEELAANKAIKQSFHALDDSEKDSFLWKILDGLPQEAKMVTFANTKRRIDHLAGACWSEGYGASAIHGGKTQQERDEALKQFAEGKWPLMFATDVAARGLDIKGVTHVLNFDMPRDVEQYVHRIGRTARAGSKGESITFWNKDYDVACAPALAKIAREAGQIVPEWLEKWASKAAKQKQDKNWKV